jgi:Flp pilus assembly protein TadD
VALSGAGDDVGALDQFRQITKAAPRYARGYVGFADLQLRLGNVSGAIDAYRQALRLQPDNVVALANLGLLLATRGETAEAMTLLKRALEVEPRALSPRRQIARLLMAQGKYVEMEAEGRMLVSSAPNDPESHNLLGVALASQQQFAPAVEQFEAALRFDPSNQNARVNLARLAARVKLLRE